MRGHSWADGEVVHRLEINFLSPNYEKLSYKVNKIRCGQHLRDRDLNNILCPSL